MGYISGFFEHYKGNDVEAARALLKSLREEKGIVLKRASIQKILGIKNKLQLPDDLEHQEHIADYLSESGIIDYSHLRDSPIIYGRHVNAPRTMKNLAKEHNTYKTTVADTHAEKYLAYLRDHSFQLGGHFLEDLLPREQIHEMDLESNAGLIGEFKLMLAVCPPGWTDLHLKNSRFKLNDVWYNDFESKAENILKNMNHKTLTHGICPDCYTLL